MKSIKNMYLLSNRVALYNEVLCLLGLGSMSETKRADEYSDMDFFLVVKNGSKDRFLYQLDWLEIHPILFTFKNSNDGNKVLFSDGTFAEYAVFTEDEILNATYTKGKIYYQKETYLENISDCKNIKFKKPIDISYHVNEALSNLYIGLKREKRGEYASATTFIQSYAYQLVVQLFPYCFENTIEFEDYFVYERRIEFHFKEAKSIISNMRQGYLKNKESALEILNFLIKYFNPNEFIVKEIKDMIHS